MEQKKEKDLNYIAKLEQAIAKKYGEEAVQHPMSEWTEEKEKKYLEQIKELKEEEDEKTKKELKNGFLLSKKLINVSERICPVCKVYSFSKHDDVYMSKYKCCFKCYIKYVEGPGREEKWLKKIEEEEKNERNG